MEPYRTVGELKRFNRRYTAFARAEWDEGSPAHATRREHPSGPAKAGYSAEDFALHAGAWAVARRTQDYGRVMEREGDSGPAGSDEAGSAEDFTCRVKSAARLYGAGLVGVSRVHPLWVYACDADEGPLELPEGIDTAVVMAVPMDYHLLRTSPSAVAGAATGNGYSRMAFTATCVARYLTDLGWRAIPSGNDTALSIPLAIDAGLGELGRNGLLITQRHGPRVRLCKVFTDAPLVPDKPVSFGVREFCDVCMKCADECPSGSIPRGEMTDCGPTPSNSPGVLKWYVNPDTCLAFWRKNGVSCANCIRSCPFNKKAGRIHDWARGLVRMRSRAIDRALVWLDDGLGYGKQVSPDALRRDTA